MDITIVQNKLFTVRNTQILISITLNVTHVAYFHNCKSLFAVITSCSDAGETNVFSCIISLKNGVFNMMFRSKLAVFASTFVLSGFVFAADNIICPDIADIKAESMTMVEEIGLDYFITYNVSNYSTNSQWGFAIAPIQADSEDDALNVANDLLNNMTAPGVLQRKDPTICGYATGENHVLAFAVEGVTSPIQMRQYVNK